MSLTVVSGRAANVTQGSDFTYAATSQHGPVAIKNQLVSMRLDNKPVMFRTRTLPNISEGDEIAAAGTEKNGTLEALAVRNLTTGSFYYPGTMSVMILSGLLILLGLPLIAFLGFGLLFIGIGAFMIMKALRIRQAVSLLQAHRGATA